MIKSLSLRLLLVLASVSQICAQEKPQVTPREIISMMDACVQANFSKNEEGKLVYKDFQNSKIEYATEPVIVQETLKELFNLIHWKRLGWETLPIELDWFFGEHNPALKKSVLQSVVAGDEQALFQMHLIRWHDEWRDGRDLVERVRKKEAQDVIKKRFALLTAINTKNADEVLAACKKLQGTSKPKPFVAKAAAINRLVYLKRDVPCIKPEKQEENAQ